MIALTVLQVAYQWARKKPRQAARPVNREEKFPQTGCKPARNLFTLAHNG